MAIEGFDEVKVNTILELLKAEFEEEE
jgi:hypothetical protein